MSPAEEQLPNEDPEDMDPIDIVHQCLKKYVGLKLYQVNKYSSLHSNEPNEIQMLFETPEGTLLEILVPYNGFMDID